MITHPTLTMQLIVQHQTEARWEAAQDRLARRIRTAQDHGRPRLFQAAMRRVANLGAPSPVNGEHALGGQE